MLHLRVETNVWEWSYFYFKRNICTYIFPGWTQIITSLQDVLDKLLIKKKMFLTNQYYLIITYLKKSECIFSGNVNEQLSAFSILFLQLELGFCFIWSSALSGPVLLALSDECIFPGIVNEQFCASSFCVYLSTPNGA